MSQSAPILTQNRSLSKALDTEAGIKDPISEIMYRIRALPYEDRLEIYKKQRIKN